MLKGTFTDNEVASHVGKNDSNNNASWQMDELRTVGARDEGGITGDLDGLRLGLFEGPLLGLRDGIFVGDETTGVFEGDFVGC